MLFSKIHRFSNGLPSNVVTLPSYSVLWVPTLIPNLVVRLKRSPLRVEHPPTMKPFEEKHRLVERLLP